MAKVVAVLVLPENNLYKYKKTEVHYGELRFFYFLHLKIKVLVLLGAVLCYGDMFRPLTRQNKRKETDYGRRRSRRGRGGRNC